jgi:4'-phosphopantetheinyl transferase
MTPPSRGEVHVWRIEVEGGARRALAEILAAYLGGPAETKPAVAGSGKPRLAEAPGRLSFNLSHSGGLALVAIAPGGVEVGVDVERLRPRRDLVRLAARWLAEDDAVAVAGATSDDERERLFYAAWTRHEARVKCTGAGLGGPPPGDEIVARRLEVGAGYAAAVAFERGAAGGREPRIELRQG